MATVAAQAVPTAAPPALRRVALVGNPNTGKSTVFNALAGMNARTGNYPGVTIEKKLGRFRAGEQLIELVDLPGTYSLAPRSPDELVAVDVLTGDAAVSEPVDAILCVVNATLLQRNLFLLSQVLELGKPVVVAVNMVDAAEARGQRIDAERLSQSLGVPVVLTSASRRVGIDQLRATMVAAANATEGPAPACPLPPAFYQARDGLKASLAGRSAAGESLPDDYVFERALLDQGGEAERRLLRRFGPETADAIDAARRQLTEAEGLPADVECNARYAWAREKLQGIISQSSTTGTSWTDRLDALLTHRVFGLVIFFALMFTVFQAIYTFAQWPMEIFETTQGWVADAVTGALEPGMLRSLVVDGVIAGVGGVLIFLPQIALLFLFIAILEDCGYMSRAAFLVDRVMSAFGLSGKAFLPLMSSFACAIPGVMATRVIENRRDRLTTMMVAPLMSCSARLPVYLLLIAAFIPAQAYLGGLVTLQGLVLMGMYLLGVVVAIPVAFLLKKTVLRGEPAPFVLELPEYKWPSIPVLVERVYQSCKAFVLRAGTLIFAASVLIWAAGFLPGDHSQQFALQAQIEQLETDLAAATPERPAAEEAATAERPAAPEGLAVSELVAELEAAQAAHNRESSRLLETSFLGRTGHFIEPVVRPLGWDWKIGVGALASFPAREVIIATLGTVYSLGGEVDEEDEGLVSALRSARWPDGSPVYTVPVALSIMVFFALCAQCVSTLLVIRRETNSWRWPIFSFTYMTVLAYVAALVVYQVGSRIG
ncbi:ferrous iron transport protein B [Candidatus Laterigemmans baculatus]|uniref:ferrous iron transport protein B n=1 Tax=Candidatus Laterigemmans baculatus TaxID=2770505 RepID=UPI001F2B7303|nr:ferrous iron transport protein B [Candidatus Laterigemmans baculatus]